MPGQRPPAAGAVSGRWDACPLLWPGHARSGMIAADSAAAEPATDRGGIDAQEAEDR